jgi:hypothetical protein
LQLIVAMAIAVFGPVWTLEYWQAWAYLLVFVGSAAIITHPVLVETQSQAPSMYAGALVMLLGTPLALGSWWGLLLMIPVPPGPVHLVIRTCS